MSAGSVEALRARPVEIPAPQPVEMAGGAMVAHPVVLIELRSSEGLCGRSYLRTYSAVALRALAALLEDLADMVVGQPAVPEQLEAHLPHPLRLLGLRGLVGAALAGIDMALWDLQAQAAGRPLARLLGADVDRVPAYATIRSRDPRAAAGEAEAAVARGFKAVKLKLGGQSPEADERLVGAVRSGVGADVEIMGDYNQSLGVAEALARAPQLDALGLSWIEEPTRADDLAGHARIAASLATPVQLGESLEGPAELQRSIDAGASRLVMLDAMKIGGVTGWRQASAMAADAGLRVSSHSFAEFSVHLLAATPTAHWLEHLDHLEPVSERPLQIVDGHAEVPAEPGVGLSWDEAALARLGAAARGARRARWCRSEPASDSWSRRGESSSELDRNAVIEQLERLHEAQGAFYSGGPGAPLRELLTDDVVWSVPGNNSIAGTYEGIAAVMSYFARRRQLSSRTFVMSPGEVLVGDREYAAVLTDGTAVLGGRVRHWSTVGLYRLRGDRIAACWLLPLSPQEFDSIWTAST
jgi:mandelate racemase